MGQKMTSVHSVYVREYLNKLNAWINTMSSGTLYEYSNLISVIIFKMVL